MEYYEIGIRFQGLRMIKSVPTCEDNVIHSLVIIIITMATLLYSKPDCKNHLKKKYIKLHRTENSNNCK